MAPLIDVLFLLLIFLLVTSNFDHRRVLEVSLPEATTAAAAPAVSKTQERVITIFEDGRLEWNGVETDLNTLSVFLMSLSPEEQLLPIFVRGDARSPLGAGIEVMDRLRQIGFHNYFFEVIPKAQ